MRISDWSSDVCSSDLVYPAFPDDAKGLLAAAVEDPNPVLFFEHKHLYRTTRGDVPDDYYTTPIGKARLVREGQAASIITYGLGVHWALDLLEQESSEERRVGKECVSTWISRWSTCTLKTNRKRNNR